MRPRNTIDVAASRYGRRWVIGIFLVWLIAFELIVGRLYGWSTPASSQDTARSALVLALGCVVAFIAGKRAEARYRRSHGAHLG
jgi:hypothetical protein